MKWWHFAGDAAAVWVSYKVGCRMGAARAVAACGCAGMTPAKPNAAVAAPAPVEAVREASPDALRAVGI
jgi:hypothetical protein